MPCIWICVLIACLACLVESSRSLQGEQYILAPKDRDLKPLTIYASEGTVTNPELLLTNTRSGSTTTFSGVNSTLTLDFGKNIAGTVHFTVDSSSGPDEFVGFTFTESSLWISPYHCDSGTSALFDDPLWFHVPTAGKYGAPSTLR